MPALDAAELLAAHDAELRLFSAEPPEGVEIERDGPLQRLFGLGPRGLILYRDLGGLDGAELDALIARQVEVFASRGEPFEWKLFSHDRPADLAGRLAAAGFVPEDTETVVIAAVADVAGVPRLPEGVSLREVSSRGELERIEALEHAVWQNDQSWVADALEAEQAADPDGVAIVLVEAHGEAVCAAWARFERGSEFATFWGGATLPAWRGRGLYRATVAYRATLAAARGVRYLTVDASDESRPVLERLGFAAVTTTTPYVWSPAADRPRPHRS